MFRHSRLFLAVTCALSAACSAGGESARSMRVSAESSAAIAQGSGLPAILREPVPVTRDAQDVEFRRAAQAAWKFVNANYEPATGLVHAQPDWAFPTLWDIGSAMGATYGALQLGFITQAEYVDRTRRLIATLQRATLYDNAVFGRNYDARTGALVDEAGKPSTRGTGYSALDLGRLFTWLKIAALTAPELASSAEAVTKRIRVDRVVQDGYLRGEQIMKGATTPEKYQEGRLGYEQYAAEGLALWGLRAKNALQVDKHRRKASVLGVQVSSDARGLDRLTSEPFILHGMEIGLSGRMQEIALQTLAAQAQRYVKTGTVTVASEDALKIPPHYFYYYCVLCSGREFVINVHSPGVELDAPRWVSAKAAYAWHALMPSRYTWMAVETVRPALDSTRGWATGVMEGTGKSTETYTLNTAGIVLEAAAYMKRGKPFAQP